MCDSASAGYSIDATDIPAKRLACGFVDIRDASVIEVPNRQRKTDFSRPMAQLLDSQTGENSTTRLLISILLSQTNKRRWED
jgi:hypothetical protein